MSTNYDQHFRHFASSLEAVIAGYGSTDEDFTARQKRQVETLVHLEMEFRKALIRDKAGPDVYKAFVRYIVSHRRNILAARPFFRERQDIFKRDISPVLRENQDRALYRFNINYPFIAFAMKNGKFNRRTRVWKVAQKVTAARAELIEMNMPLAISRARIFKKLTPQSHLEYMDLVQIANEGLIAAVDKFVLPYTPVFRAVIIGRISGNLIEDYSDTMLHFYPSDKRKLYKARKARRKTDDMSADAIAEKVNEQADKNHRTNASEITQLLAASSHVSLDAPAPETSFVAEDDPSSGIDRYEADPETRPDNIAEKNEVNRILYATISQLSIFEQKLLRLKGLDL